MSAELVEINNLSRDIKDIKGVLEALTQLLRDSQINQAGSDKLSYHTRLQIMSGVEDLQKWTIRAEKSLEDLKTRTTNLEDDHDNHDELIQEIHSIVSLNQERFEQLLGYKSDPVGNPLRNSINEILQSSRTLTHKDVHTGEPLDGFKMLVARVSDAFWATIGLGVLLLGFWLLRPHLPIPQSTPAPSAPTR